MAFKKFGGIVFIPSFEEALDHAWNRLLDGQDEAEIPDVIRFAEIEKFWDSYRIEFLAKIKEDRYHPSHVEIVDLPKDRLTVRPLARLTVEDRLYYEACIFSIIQDIDRVIPNSVYSYRWSVWKGDLRKPKGSWVTMQKHGRSYNIKNSHLWMAKTDVSAFYENIDTGTLLQEIDGLTQNKEAVSRLRSFLDSFQEMNYVRGIPQGVDGSGILANLYLVPIDRTIQQSALRHFRYSDDIIIFGPNHEILRDCLLKVNRAFRGRRLSMSGPKTRVLHPDEIASAFEDIEKDYIRDNVRSAKIVAPEQVRHYFNKAVDDGEVNIRNLRFSLNQLKALDDSYATDWIIKNFNRIPQVAQDVISYLEHFGISSYDPVYRFCEDTLSSRTYQTYPYAEFHLFGLAIRNQINSLPLHEVAWKILANRNEESFLREYAARYIGLNPQAGDGALLRQEFRDNPYYSIRRALLAAIYETQQDSMAWLDSIENSSPDLRWVCRYLKTQPKIPFPARKINK